MSQPFVSSFGEKKLHVLDFGAVALYFAAVLAVGFWSMFRSNRSTVTGYFLAGRFMTWIPIGASLFASNIGSEHFIGLAGSGAADGIGVGAFELNALVFLQLLGWVFLPVYIAARVDTLPEYMSKRFGGQRIRIYLALLSLVLYVFTKVSVNMYSGALFVQGSLGWNIYVSVALILALTAVCTVTGGLAAVMYVETLQCFMMVGSAILLAIFSFIEVGGYGSLVTKYKALGDREDWGNSSCGRPNPKAFTMLRGPSDPDYPWPGFLFGQSPASVWYWAADQMMVQRALAAKNLSHAQGATIFAGVLKVLPLFVIVFPGMISRVLYPEVVGCVDDCLARCGNADGCSNTAYPMLVMNLMPNGLRGVMLAGMLAALMSDLASVFNSSSTLFTLDIWRRMRPLATNAEVMIVGRIFVIVMVVVAVLWVPIVSGTQGAQLYIYIQSVAADLAPPIAAVYLLAILWRRTNEQGAFSGLLVGAVLGGGRLISDFIYRAPKCGETDNRPWFVGRVQYMYFALALFVIVAMTTIVVSLLTKPPEQFRLVRTTFWTRFDSAVRSDEETSVSTAALKYEETVELQEIGEVRPDGRRFSVEKEDAVIPDSQCDNSGGMSSFGRICVWFCGFNASTAFEQGQKSPERPAELASLEQTAFERRVLTAALVAILALAVFLFIFFSDI